MDGTNSHPPSSRGCQNQMRKGCRSPDGTNDNGGDCGLTGTPLNGSC